jgi:hypothetical protein
MVAVINPIVDFHRQVIAHAGRTCYASARMRAAAELKTGKTKHKGKTEKIQRNIKNKKIIKKCRKK